MLFLRNIFGHHVFWALVMKFTGRGYFWRVSERLLPSQVRASMAVRALRQTDRASVKLNENTQHRNERAKSKIVKDLEESCFMDPKYSTLDHQTNRNKDDNAKLHM